MITDQPAYLNLGQNQIFKRYLVHRNEPNWNLTGPSVSPDLAWDIDENGTIVGFQENSGLRICSDGITFQHLAVDFGFGENVNKVAIKLSEGRLWVAAAPFEEGDYLDVCHTYVDDYLTVENPHRGVIQFPVDHIAWSRVKNGIYYTVRLPAENDADRDIKTYELRFFDYDLDTWYSLHTFIGHVIDGFDCKAINGKDVLIVSGDTAPLYTYSSSIAYNPTITEEARKSLCTYVITHKDEFPTVAGPFPIEVVERANNTHFRRNARLSLIRHTIPKELDVLYATCYGSDSDTNGDGSTTSVTALMYYTSTDGINWSQQQYININISNYQNGFVLLNRDGEIYVVGASTYHASKGTIYFGQNHPQTVYDVSVFVQSHSGQVYQGRSSSYKMKNDPRLGALDLFNSPNALTMITEISLDEVDWYILSVEYIDAIQPSRDKADWDFEIQARDKFGFMTDGVTAIDSMQMDNTIYLRDNYLPLGTEEDSGLAHSVAVKGTWITANNQLTPVFPADGSESPTTGYSIAFSTAKSGMEEGEVTAIFKPPERRLNGQFMGLVFRAVDQSNFYALTMQRFTYSYMVGPDLIYDDTVAFYLSYRDPDHPFLIHKLLWFEDSDGDGSFLAAYDAGEPICMKVRFRGRKVEYFAGLIGSDIEFDGHRIEVVLNKLGEFILDGDTAESDSTYRDPVLHSGYTGVIAYDFPPPDDAPTESGYPVWQRSFDFQDGPGGWERLDAQWNTAGYFTIYMDGMRNFISYPCPIFSTPFCNTITIKTDPGVQLRIGAGFTCENYQTADSLGFVTFTDPTFANWSNPGPGFQPWWQGSFWIQATTECNIYEISAQGNYSYCPFDKTWSHTFDFEQDDGGFSQVATAEYEAGVGWKPSTGTDFTIRFDFAHICKLHYLKFEHQDASMFIPELGPYHQSTNQFAVPLNEHHFNCYNKVSEYIEFEVFGISMDTPYVKKLTIWGVGANPFIEDENVGRQIIRVSLDDAPCPFDEVAIDADKPYIKIYQDFRPDTTGSPAYDIFDAAVTVLAGFHSDLGVRRMDYVNGFLGGYSPQHIYSFIGTTVTDNIPSSRMNYPAESTQVMYVEATTIEAWQAIPAPGTFGVWQFEVNNFDRPLTIENLFDRYAAYASIHRTSYKSYEDNFNSFDLDETGYYEKSIDLTSIQRALPAASVPGYAILSAAMPRNYWFEVTAHIRDWQIIFNATTIDEDHYRVESVYNTGTNKTTIYLNKYGNDEELLKTLYQCTEEFLNTSGRLKFVVRDVLLDSVLNRRTLVLSVWVDDFHILTTSIDDTDMPGHRIGLGFGTADDGTVLFSDVRIPNMLDILEWSSLDAGENPILATSRAIEDRYIKMFLDRYDVLHVFKPVDGVDVTTLTQGGDGMISVARNWDLRQIFSDLRFRGPFHWVRRVDKELAGRYRRRFFQMDNTSQFSSEDCIREADAIFKRQKEMLGAAEIRINGQILLEAEDLIAAPNDANNSYDRYILEGYSYEARAGNFSSNLSVRANLG